jgi:hypothetical protein
VLKQARHRASGSVCGYQLVATEGCLPLALTAGDEDGISQLIGKAIERLLGRVVAAPFRDSRARIGQYVGPPLLRCRLLWVRPGAALDEITGFHHGGDQSRDIGQRDIEQDEIRRHDAAVH